MTARASRWRIVVVALVIVLIVAALAAWRYSGPLLSLLHLKSAIEARSEADVVRYVDFDELKRNTGDYIDHKLEQKNEDKFLGGLRTKVEGAIAGVAIEAMATPSGLIHLACDVGEDGEVDFTPRPPGTPCEFNFKFKGMEYLLPTRFRLRAEQPQGGDVAIILDKGADAQWRVVAFTGSGPLSK